MDFFGLIGTWKSGGSKSLEDLATVRKRTRPVGAETERRRTRGQTAERGKEKTEEDARHR